MRRFFGFLTTLALLVCASSPTIGQDPPAGPGAGFIKCWSVKTSPDPAATKMPKSQGFFIQRVTAPHGQYFVIVAEEPHELGQDWTEAHFVLDGSKLEAEFDPRGGYTFWRLELSSDGTKISATGIPAGPGDESAGTWEGSEETGG